jgi:lipopolysaccharide export system permease protein
VTANRIRFSGGVWVVEGVQIRDFRSPVLSVTRLDSLRRPDLTITPDDLANVRVEPEELNYVDLRSMIERLKISGVRAGKWVVDLGFKISQPFATVILVLFGVPFAAFRRRGGLVFGFGLSLLVCFVFFGFMQVGKIFGYQGYVGAIPAAWAGNAVFGLLGLYLVIRVPK